MCITGLFVSHAASLLSSFPRLLWQMDWMVFRLKLRISNSRHCSTSEPKAAPDMELSSFKIQKQIMFSWNTERLGERASSPSSDNRLILGRLSCIREDSLKRHGVSVEIQAEELRNYLVAKALWFAEMTFTEEDNVLKSDRAIFRNRMEIFSRLVTL